MARPDRDEAQAAFDADAAREAAKRARTRDAKRRWREANREHVAEKIREWKQEHPERVRELNRRWREQHLDRAREQNREYWRRTAARKRRQAETRRKSRERAKAWRQEHPERVRAYQQRWVEENRDKVREYANRYYATHRDEVNARAAARRDADPERTKRTKKEWAERNKERRADYQRNRRSNPDVYQAELEANAAARRLKRALMREGLPPKRVHPVTAAERRANEREAAEYFDDPELNEHLRQFTVFQATLTEHMLAHGARMREFAEAYAERRARMGLPAADVERITYARAVEVVLAELGRVDLLTSADVAAAVRGTRVVVRREERREQFEQLVSALVLLVEHDTIRLQKEAAFENRARRERGRPSVSVDSLVVQLATEELLSKLAIDRLTVEDARAAGRLAKARLGADACAAVVASSGMHRDARHFNFNG
ncbi:hypothetical protein [Agromyces larvae]|uniref:Uncharacterized protein n=1 Tax=Agromyces larvae TaxID=2929802 RepID=A0ABY4C3F7_9MICO|nr:hypothetical protein [Agromyces larvae]UOE44957.1 hypothetical protein MTO99_04030 [Agromyces larvae]